MTPEETISSETVFSGRAVKLRIDTVRTDSGRWTTREIVEHADCVAVVAIDADDNVLLVKQFRKPVEKELLEIPAGGIEPGESPEAAVIREMREETGFWPQRVVHLGGFYSSPGYGTEFLYLYLAADLKSSQLNAEDTEEIVLVRVPLPRVMELITSGGICDAKSIAGIMMYLEYRKTH